MALVKTKTQNEGLDYLILIASSVINEIISQPDNEFSRHKTKIQWSEEKFFELLEKQPYLLGKENLCLEWMQEAFEKILGCYTSEING